MTDIYTLEEGVIYTVTKPFTDYYQSHLAPDASRAAVCVQREMRQSMRQPMVRPMRTTARRTKVRPRRRATLAPK